MGSWALSMEKLLTAGQVAEILNVSTAWVYDHAYGSGPSISINSLKR